jgi:putative acetyltransferase
MQQPLQSSQLQAGANFEIRSGGLDDPQVAELLEDHLRDMRSVSPPESVHALDLSKLKKPEITFWSVWNGAELVGCGALKRLDAEHAELKSMRTARSYRRVGLGKLILEHIMGEARRRGYRRLSLETGSMPFFEPARTLYASYGFVECPPFADYRVDPYSVCMTRGL